MKSIKLAACAALFSAALVSAAAASPAVANLEAMKIDTGYQDANGNLIIRFAYQTTLFGGPGNPSFVGSELTFYGNAEGLYQLDETGFGGSSVRYSLSFLDQTQEESDGHFYAGVDVDNIFVEKDQYLLVCGGKKLDFKPISDNLKAILQSKVRSGELPLIALSEDFRTPSGLYLSKQGAKEVFIYIDTPEYQYGQSYRFFMGALGKLKERKIANVVYETETIRFELKDGLVFEAPNGGEREAGFLSGSSAGSSKFEELETYQFDLTTLGIDGVPTKVKDLKTPCELLK